ncbi:MAG: TonB-dependent receptor, partial [Gemmatimonadota bacterium]|nr:TonB-dependent receptor [Gemmatimonadota bacterium]
MRSLSVFTVLLLAFSHSTAHAQRPISRGSGPGTVRGVVVAAEGNQPLASARVALRSAADSTIARRGTTDAAGRFQVTNLPVGRYRVTVLLTGFAPLARDVTLTAVAPVVELGTLALAANVFALEGISVEVERSAVTVAPDRTAYSTRDMPVASGGSATDVLRSVPELEVDIEGSVSLRGTAAQIYLNGRAAPMSGEALEQFLQQFPADRIDRVEVIANPSARFDAEGAGGIVNIVLKKNVDLGLSGSLFTNSSTRGDLGGGGRLAYQRGRLTVFGGSFLRLGNRNGTSYDLRRNLLTTPITSLEQNGWSDTDRFSANVDLTAEWKLTERSTLWGEVGVNQFDSGSEGITEYTLTDALLTPLERYDRSVDRDSDRFNR